MNFLSIVRKVCKAQDHYEDCEGCPLLFNNKCEFEKLPYEWDLKRLLPVIRKIQNSKVIKNSTHNKQCTPCNTCRFFEPSCGCTVPGTCLGYESKHGVHL